MTYFLPSESLFSKPLLSFILPTLSYKCMCFICLKWQNKTKTKSSACEKGACTESILKNWDVHETESHVTGISKAVPLMASAWFTLSTHFMLSIGTCNTTSCRHRYILECVPFATTYRHRARLMTWYFQVRVKANPVYYSSRNFAHLEHLKDDKHTYECRCGLSLDILLRICVWLRHSKLSIVSNLPSSD